VIDARFVPIEQWPGPRTKSRKFSPFRSNYLSTLDLLEEELRHLRARDIVIQSGFSRAQLRNDGWPKAGEKPTDPGIIISFTSPNGPLSFPCDRYTDFQANMRAIGLSLEALRAVDRYGVTRQAEQYKGWQQIAAPGATSHFANAEEAADFIVVQARGFQESFMQRHVIRSDKVRKDLYRQAAARLHPDKGGNHDQFVLLQEALAILEATA
jgi:hypothetical protein